MFFFRTTAVHLIWGVFHWNVSTQLWRGIVYANETKSVSIDCVLFSPLFYCLFITKMCSFSIEPFPSVLFVPQFFFPWNSLFNLPFFKKTASKHYGDGCKPTAVMLDNGLWPLIVHMWCAVVLCTMHLNSHYCTSHQQWYKWKKREENWILF